jgi:Bacterial PH domain
VAETPQRFVVYPADRKFARSAVFPAGMFLVVAAIFIPADNPIKFIAALFGLPFLMWSSSVIWRRRVEVTEQNVTVVNVFSRHEVPWSELTDIEIDIEKNDDGTDYYLAFITPHRRIRADMPYDNGDELSKVRARILEAREPLAHHSGGWVPQRADDQPERRTRTVRDWLLLALVGAVVFFFGLPFIFVLVLDAVPLTGDWLTDHVPFWDELTDFYDWILRHAP